MSNDFFVFHHLQESVPNRKHCFQLELNWGGAQYFIAKMLAKLSGRIKFALKVEM